ncbi:MAG: hypothetical protein H7Z43_07475 [Clostridia bacterium]|nr:hypothetical protein [Deltaproteobacteria bacterium]
MQNLHTLVCELLATKAVLAHASRRVTNTTDVVTTLRIMRVHDHNGKRSPLWKSARTIVRLDSWRVDAERVELLDTRHFASSLLPEALSDAQWLELVRRYSPARLRVGQPIGIKLQKSCPSERPKDFRSKLSKGGQIRMVDDTFWTWVTRCQSKRRFQPKGPKASTERLLAPSCKATRTHSLVSNSIYNRGPKHSESSSRANGTVRWLPKNYACFVFSFANKLPHVVLFSGR